MYIYILRIVTGPVEIYKMLKCQGTYVLEAKLRELTFQGILT